MGIETFETSLGFIESPRPGWASETLSQKQMVPQCTAHSSVERTMTAVIRMTVVCLRFSMLFGYKQVCMKQ